MNDEENLHTLSIPQAGKRYFGISKPASYAAAKRGEIPTIKIGKKLLVPVVRMERMMNGEEEKK